MTLDVRNRRLQADLHGLLDLSRRSPAITVRALNDVCDRFEVTYSCLGLEWLPEQTEPSIRAEHRLDIYLHLDYPRLPPRLLWLTPIFHPNILPPDRNGGVCIGHWSPAESLDQLVLRIGEMIQYRNFSTVDALDPLAAKWAEHNRAQLPLDNTPLLRPERDTAASGISSGAAV